MDRTKIKQFMLQLSAEAGEFLRHNFYTIKSADARAGGGIVTNTDRQLESIMSRRIRQAFPEHGIKIIGGEEFNLAAGGQWVIDAIDGSSHFSRNVPIYTTTLAFLENGRTIMAAVNHPQTRQLFFAAQNEGAYLNGLAIEVSQTSDLSYAFLFVELPEQKFTEQDIAADFENNLKIIKILLEKSAQVETWRIGSLGQCLVASGAFDAYLDLSGSSQRLSQLASRLIMQEAGGKIIDLKNLKPEFTQVLAANEPLAEVLIDLIREIGL